MSKTKYNTTDLSPDTAMERHVYHRDQFAHYLRWSHILKIAKIGMTILDFGCGQGNLFEVFYRNRYKPKQYVGIDIREKTIKNAKQKFSMCDNATFITKDLCEPLDLDTTFDIICSFEVFEHIGHWNADKYLSNIVNHMDDNTVLYLSTPNYDPTVGAASNHMIPHPNDPGELTVGEWGYDELHSKLSEYFTIVKTYGTFASQKDYKQHLNSWQSEVYNNLKEYYDSNLVSNIMAPLVDARYARNILWVLKLK